MSKPKKKKYTRIGDLIAEWSKDPDSKKHIEDGRRWVKELSKKIKSE